MWTYNYSDELYHHGIKGQKWGVRRYQNKDGTLTAAGRRRYAEGKKNYKDDKNRLLNTDDGYVLKSGSTVQRISTEKEQSVRSYAYVSFTRHDNRFYNKNFSENLRFAGYDDVIDDNDVSGLGSRGYEPNEIPDSPLLILDADKVMSNKRFKKM